MIKRSEHSADKKFTIIARPLAQDRRLSFQARGLLVYILSKPPNWKAKYDDLRREGGIGRTALDNIVKELQAAGYITRRRERNEDGKIGWIMVVSEEPQASETPENQCMPTYTGTSARPTTVDKHTLAIDSTGARAGSSVDLRDNTKRKSGSARVIRYSISDVMANLALIDGFKEPIMVDYNGTRSWAELVKEYLRNRLANGGWGTKHQKQTATLEQIEADLHGYIALYGRNEVARNGHNGNGVKQLPNGLPDVHYTSPEELERLLGR